MISHQPTQQDKELITRLELFAILYRVLGAFMMILIVYLVFVQGLDAKHMGFIGSETELKALAIRFVITLCLLIVAAILSFSTTGLLLNRGSWSKVVTTVALLCLCVPFGTAIGIPCLVLLSRTTTRDYLDQMP
jgi:ABC-type proline/glycine betaine transport system permease subunit